MPSIIKVDQIQSDTGNVTVTGNVAFSAGSAAAPAIAPLNDTNTGIFFPAADTIAFAEGGTEVVRIDSSGSVGVATSSPLAKLDVNGTSLFRDIQYRYQAANTATISAPATLTAAQLLTQIVPIEGGAQNVTMPTGTSLDSALPTNFPVNGAFDFSIVNTDAGSQSLLVNTGVTIFGNPSIPSSDSGMFRLRKTGTATYVVYRLG